MQIISRKQWGARPPRSVQTVAASRRRRFVVHYSAASPDQTPKVIQAYHMDTKKWSDIGYNFLVDDDGRIYEGRGWDVVGAHAAGYNTESIGVCFIGRDRAGVTDAGPKVRAAIRWLYDEACRRTGRTLTRNGHRDVGSTQCPGDELYAWVHAGMPVDDTAPAPSPKPPATSGQLVVDGQLGPATITRWQQIMGTPVDGRITEPSALVKAVQRHLNAKVRASLVVDGAGICQDGRPYKTVRALQRYLGTEQDGIMSMPVSAVVKAVQRRLNSGRF
ncbi:N-acetylmuramoyl-L-alanine amidase [Micromonospora sp. CB01531]|uniref:N-acetylmuramoyl-L-alanine amidase n=1 Tax=Micromonospora sp. CB01531 TaxID=1718947 RepID=UPI0011612E34|nr:N-acetylmuramoyl-L-alanine amidase [Micromonospora sp. CB01531]